MFLIYLSQLLTHPLDTSSELKNSYLKEGKFPSNAVILVKLGMYDMVKSQYVYGLRMYSLQRDVYPFHQFSNSIVHLDRKDTSKIILDLKHFHKVSAILNIGTEEETEEEKEVDEINPNENTPKT